MRPAVLGAAAIVLIAAYMAVRQMQAGNQAGGQVEAADSGADLSGVFDQVSNAVTDVYDEVVEGYLMPVSLNMNDKNLVAFLQMIRFAEGTIGEDGYRTLFGGSTFNGYADHPRKTIKASGYTSTAAGAYQILSKTWDDVRASLGLSDFSPASQDAAAAFLIRRRGALADVYAGRFAEAVRKCGKEWASLPGSPYGQPVKSLSEIQAIYLSYGGDITEGFTYA